MRYNKDNIDHILKEIGDLLMPLWKGYWDEILSHNKSRRLGFHGWD
jgi:hypothetical protein